jgi:hypothetical protein
MSKLIVYYQDKEIFNSDEKDTLEDIIETIFELEKDDQEYKDRKAFQLCLKKIISLSRLTYAHKIAKVVLFEQIYRGLCIKNNHPYHK